LIFRIACVLGVILLFFLVLIPFGLMGKALFDLIKRRRNPEKRLYNNGDNVNYESNDVNDERY
jgi:hypothetical protein